MVYKDALIDEIKQRNETTYLTIGFRWKGPTTMDKPLSPSEAVEWVEQAYSKYALITLEERQKRLCMNAYTTNDMW